MENNQQPDYDYSELLISRRMLLRREEYEVDHPIFRYWLNKAKFLEVFEIGYKSVDRALITALVER